MDAPTVRNQVVWVDIPCEDLDRAIAFYSVLIGAEVFKEEGQGFALGGLPHVGASVGGCLVMSPDHRPSDQGVLIYLNCQDRLDEAVQAARDGGGEVLLEKQSIGPHGWRAIVRDSEGNRVALHSM